MLELLVRSYWAGTAAIAESRKNRVGFWVSGGTFLVFVFASGVGFRGLVVTGRFSCNYRGGISAVRCMLCLVRVCWAIKTKHDPLS